MGKWIALSGLLGLALGLGAMAGYDRAMMKEAERKEIGARTRLASYQMEMATERDKQRKREAVLVQCAADLKRWAADLKLGQQMLEDQAKLDAMLLKIQAKWAEDGQ